MTILDQIETDAKEAEQSAVRIINAMAEKYPLGADFERYSFDVLQMIKLCGDDRVVKLIALVRVFQEATQKVSAGMQLSSTARAGDPSQHDKMVMEAMWAGTLEQALQLFDEFCKETDNAN